MDVITDMKFITNKGRDFGPYGKCGKGHETKWTRFKKEFRKRHVRLDKLRDQVQMTANKFTGDRYVKLFKEMSKFYSQISIMDLIFEGLSINENFCNNLFASIFQPTRRRGRFITCKLSPKK